jgi:hypothetical protein
MLIAVAIMAVGVMMGRKPLAGSCGGLAGLGMKSACEVCGGSQQVCDEQKGKRVRLAREQQELAYDAMAEPRRKR